MFVLRTEVGVYNCNVPRPRLARVGEANPIWRKDIDDWSWRSSSETPSGVEALFFFFFDSTRKIAANQVREKGRRWQRHDQVLLTQCLAALNQARESSTKRCRD